VAKGDINKKRMRITIEIIYYFDVRLTQFLIIVAKGDMNKKRMRIIAIDV
jgi:hypothetical protein